MTKTTRKPVAEDPAPGPARLKPRFRIVRGHDVLVGPGMVELLEAIRRTGSLREAARELQMSYMHAWRLVKTMNRGFRDPLVELSRGGAVRGGARLTTRGEEVLGLYREMEAETLRAVATTWKRFRRLLS